MPYTKHWNWQNGNWPNFTYRANDLNRVINEYIQISSNLQGQVLQLEQNNKSEAYIFLMVEEAINTSEIEGENLIFLFRNGFFRKKRKRNCKVSYGYLSKCYMGRV